MFDSLNFCFRISRLLCPHLLRRQLCLLPLSKYPRIFSALISKLTHRILASLPSSAFVTRSSIGRCVHHLRTWLLQYFLRWSFPSLLMKNLLPQKLQRFLLFFEPFYRVLFLLLRDQCRDPHLVYWSVCRNPQSLRRSWSLLRLTLWALAEHLWPSKSSYLFVSNGV